MIHSKTILIVEDEPRTRQGFVKTLEAWSCGRYRIEAAESGQAALAWLENHAAHLLITDIRMPGISGLELIEMQRKHKPFKPVAIIISGYPEFDYAQKAMQLGVVNYLLKPVDKHKLVQAVEQALLVEDDRHRIETLEKLADPRLLETKESAARYNPLVRDALRYLDEHLHEPVTLRQVADMLHLNPSYFSVLFKEQTEMTFSEYLSRLRMLRAKELLLRTSLPVGEIAERVGYQTDKYFIKVFKSFEGMSPSKYRNSVKNF
ncbi:DNA-binding response regulator [Paenibacillus macerans]|uniref:response regulator transcription factor n=1 Tax=Paenibacillus macerans TaxID=44252 RepID=UPI002081CEBD|nr:response regulator [Paenibacillus macerans]MED4954227.1 response regulator [Paenibacillus macerans]GJM73863.1 DNA-binding response regulator [Paenibacillus macerans]